MPICTCGCSRELSRSQIYNHRKRGPPFCDRVYLALRVSDHEMLARSEIDRALDRLELDYLETLADRVTMPSPASRTLAKRLEKVEKGIVFSQDSEELTNTIEVFSDTFESKAEARTTLIPKPPGECGRGRNSKKKGYHLRRAMGLSGKKELYNRIRDYVRQQVHAHGIVEDTFKDQDALSLENIYSRVRNRWPWLAQFRGYWPIKDMIKHYLQAKRYYKTKKLQAMTNDDSADEIPDALERNLETSSSEDEDNTEISRKLKKKGTYTKEHSNEGLVNTTDELDSDPASVFSDESGFFYNSQGELLEAKWNTHKKLYTLHDGRDIMLDAYPESFDSYAKEEGFNDGIQRSRNSFHHWKVGHVKYSLSDMSPVSRARARTRSCAKASPVPITVTRTSEARATPLFVSTSPKSSILNEPIRSPLQFPDRVSPLSSLKTTLVVSVHTTASEPKATLNLKRKRIMSDNEDTGDIEGTPSPPVNQPRVSKAHQVKSRF